MEGRDGSDVESKNSLKYTLVKGAVPHPHREPSLLSTIALFHMMIKAWKPVFFYKESRYMYAKIINYSA